VTQNAFTATRRAICQSVVAQDGCPDNGHEL
jgi:hypothetical protein